ncbi:MAG TPA: DUF4070 domain-containing protein, partial [Dehalococcoidales bacterium]|nr:DUF4070 domain-containing protein [Dehalococcoidales bacterium]
RLLVAHTGDNTDCSLNFVPRMNVDTLINGYKQIMQTIYTPKQYYPRIKTFLKEFKPRHYNVNIHQLRFFHVVGLFRGFWTLGVVDKGRRHFWGFILPVLFKKPKFFPLSVMLSIYGFHFRKAFEEATRGRKFQPVKVRV